VITLANRDQADTTRAAPESAFHTNGGAGRGGVSGGRRTCAADRRRLLPPDAVVIPLAEAHILRQRERLIAARNRSHQERKQT
jgi:hypothetical protein